MLKSFLIDCFIVRIDTHPRYNTLNFPVTSVLMEVLVHSLTLLVANYLVKKSLLLLETTYARDKFQHHELTCRVEIFTCQRFCLPYVSCFLIGIGLLQCIRTVEAIIML